jgi:uncharacterized protein (TIGR04255 family)
MLASRTNIRPADLPDFTDPPVTEVVLGVQFNTLDRFLAPHLGIVWERFKGDFPTLEQHPPLAPTFETFGSVPQFVPNLIVPMFGGYEMPRVFLINPDKTQLLQIQRDRFLHNWRKIQSGGDYPRFERMLERFQSGLEMFAKVISEQKLGEVVPNQCEVSYINQIPIAEHDDIFALLKKLFPQQTGGLELEGIGDPEDLRLLLRYVMRDDKEAPLGRLIVAAEPARRSDGIPIVQLTFTVRGRPATANISGVLEFLERGRIHMGRAFVKLTGSEMHKIWGRKQ